MNIDLKFQDWLLVLEHASVRQYDDRAQVLLITGDLPEGWRWKLHVSVNGEAYFNSIPLAADEGGALTAVLTRDDLAFGDTVYLLQLVGERDDMRRHTNPVRLYVGASISGDGTWPELPRSFTEAQAAAEAAAARAEQAAQALQTNDSVEETLLGNTPLKLTSPATVILRASGAADYTVKSDTVAIFDLLNGTTVNASITQDDDTYVLQAGSGASKWYESYVSAVVTGLTVGTTYTFVIDNDGIAYDTEAHESIGHAVLFDGNGGTIIERTYGTNVYAFTAPTETVRVRWYPAKSATFEAGVSVALVKHIYINAADTSDYSPVVDLSGRLNASKTIRSLPSGVTIDADPACAVYAVVAESETEKPLHGKSVVVFGDSLIGMFRGKSSATAQLADQTGARVYNVGFSGCRMSDHPDNGYAAFSMWALAKAIADNDWTSQDAQASSGNDYFPEQLAKLKAIDFANVDYVVIHYGTNDFSGGVDFGEDSAATVHNTICGALRYSIETLLGAYPNLRIFVSLPVLRRWTVEGQTEFSDVHLNRNGKTLVACNEALRNVAREYKLPIIDGYYGLGINKTNVTSFYLDNAHHNEAGRKRFGAYIAEKLVSGGEIYAEDPATLPAVTSADNGKFLRVANGAYALAAVPSAESEAF